MFLNEIAAQNSVSQSHAMTNPDVETPIARMVQDGVTHSLYITYLSSDNKFCYRSYPNSTGKDVSNADLFNLLHVFSTSETLQLPLSLDTDVIEWGNCQEGL